MHKELLNNVNRMNSITTEAGATIEPKQDRVSKLTPWMAGMGIAVGHVLTGSNCSIPKQGSCSACGSCVVALGSLTAWAIIKQRSGDRPFYEHTIK